MQGSASKWAKDTGDAEQNDLNAAKANYVSHLEKSFSASFARYDQAKKPQKFTLIKQTHNWAAINQAQTH